MEIHIRLAGVQLGPYTEEQVRQHLDEGLLSLTDPAQLKGAEGWEKLSDVLAKLPPAAPIDDSEEDALPSDGPPEPEPGLSEEEPKRAPAAPPGVTHFPAKRADSSTLSAPSGSGGLAKKTLLLGPTATPVPSGAGQSASSTATTSPLVPAQSQGTKKVSRSSLVKALAQKTSPLPTKNIPPPPAPPSVPGAAVPEPPAPVRQGPKDASLAKSLAPKTVSMRATPTAPPLPAMLPTTTPLPTRPVFKPAAGPASGPIPAPSVDRGIAKKVTPMVFPDPVPTSPPPSDLSGESAKLAPPPSEGGKPPAAPVSDKPASDKGDKAPARARRKILPALLCAWAVLALLMLYYVWSPYHAASVLRDALNSGDPAALDAAIDFPAVRASLKQQFESEAVPSGTPNAAPAASSAMLPMIDHSIDLYVTPEGISGLTNKSGEFETQDQSQLISPEVAGQALLALNSLPVRDQGLASVNDFVLDRGPVMLHLQFRGTGWKLTRIDLRPELQSAATAGASAPLLSPVVDTYLERGAAKSKKADWAGAIADFTQVLTVDPQSSVAYNDRAAARQSGGDLAGAIKDYSHALSIDPQMAAAYNGRANAKAARNDFDGAIADYTDAVRLDPTMAVAYDSRGNAKTSKGDLEGAIADFTQAVTIDPNLASAYSDRGFARQANGNLDGAISDYTQALALKPSTALAYYNRGLARQSQGNLDAAIVDFDRALAFNPKIAGAYYYRGNAKSANHDLDGAIADFTEALNINPNIALAYTNRGMARQAKGDLDGAAADYGKALALDPKIAIAYYSRGQIEAQKNDLDGAIADSSQALDLDPKNAQAYGIRGFAKLTKGNLDGALADLKQFCDLAPRDHEADHARLYLWLISKAQNSKTDPDQQLSDSLENSWNSSPDDMATKTAGFLLGRINEAEYLAAASSPDAKTDQGQHCQAWYFAGMKRLLMGDKKGAIEAFHQCLATTQTDYCEYGLAQTELRALEPASAAPPAPAPAPAPAVAPTAAPEKTL